MKFISDKPNKDKKNKNSSPSQSYDSYQDTPAQPVRRAEPRPEARRAEPQKSQAKPAKQKKVPSEGGGVKKGLIIGGIAAAALVMAFFAFGAYANSQDIFPNVTMDGIDIGGMSTLEAAGTLSADPSFGSEDRILTVELPAGVEMEVSAKEAGCLLDGNTAAEAAYDACHGSGFFGNTITYLKCVTGGMELDAEQGELDETYLRNLVNSSAGSVQMALGDMDVDIGEDSITVVKGASTASIDPDDLYETVKTALLEGKSGTMEYNAVSSGGQVEELDLQQLYDMVNQEPVNAVYDPSTNSPTQSQPGRTFDLEEAQMLWDAAEVGDKVVIPLIITEPEITTENLSSMLFSEVLAQKSTTLGGSSAARINNLTKACASINDVIMNPGDEFSYNNTLGQRTTASGYMAAGAYSNGQVVSEVGGGICQVSSTLYYCTLIANLEIVDRSCHYFGVDYLPAGLDATVSWPSPDFKFRNSSDYPIKIEAYVDNASYSVVVRILGCNPEGIRVELKTETWTTSDGYGAVSYRYVYDRDGNLISSNEEARSQYHYHGSNNNSAAPTPSPSPTTSTNPTDTPTDNPPVTDAPTPPPPPPTDTPVDPTPPPVDPTPTPPPPPPVDPTVPVEG